MHLSSNEYEGLKGVEYALMLELSKLEMIIPGIHTRLQNDASRIMLEAQSCQQGNLAEWRLRLWKAVAESLKWELEQARQHVNAHVQLMPTENPKVDAYLVTLPDGTPCTTLTLEGAAALYGIDLSKLRDWVRNADLAAYHVIQHAFEDEGSGQNVYTPAMYLYAFVDLERMLSKRKLDIALDIYLSALPHGPRQRLLSKYQIKSMTELTDDIRAKLYAALFLNSKG